MPAAHTYMSNDAFQPGALGRNAARILAGLGDEGRSAAAIAVLTGLHIRTVKRHLTRLAECDLAGYCALTDSWCRVVKTDLELSEELAVVAEAYGTTGRAERRAAQHAAEREAWSKVLVLKGEKWSRRRRWRSKVSRAESSRAA